MRISFFSSSVRGFTLLELMICVAIFGLLTTVVVANYPESELRLKLAQITQSISLTYREAQLRGSAVDSQNSAVGGYGVYASSDAPDRIILFNDFIDGAVSAPSGIPIGDGLYESASPTDETNTVVNIPFRFSIAKLCVQLNGSYVCDANNTPPITSLTVMFTRPNPMPQVYVNGDKALVYSGACIEMHSIGAPAEGHIRSVQIFNSGMIRTIIGPC